MIIQDKGTDTSAVYTADTLLFKAFSSFKQKDQKMQVHFLSLNNKII